MFKTIKDYLLLKKSGDFDARFYLLKYPAIRKSDINPLMHYIRHGWKEGRYPSHEWEIKISSGNLQFDPTTNNNPIIEMIKNARAEQRAFKPNALNILILFYRFFFSTWRLRGIVFWGGYPYPEREKDGYYQRIRAIDSLFNDRWRIYIDFVHLPDRDFWYDIPEPHVLVIHPQGKSILSGFIQSWIKLCIRRAGVVYFQSIIFLSGKEFFWRNPQIIKTVDVHGAVPEEFKYQGDEHNSLYFENVECVAVTNSNYIVVVSEAMRNHLVNKYQEAISGQFIILPNVLEIPIEKIDKPYINGKPVIIYAGGLQVWQQIPKIVEAINQTIGRCIYKFYCPDPDQVLVKLNDEIRNHPNIEIKCKQREEVFQEYRSCHYGFILRENKIVNNVACPTKLTEYLAMGVIPIVDYPEIGDFKVFGMQYITLNDLLKNNIPSESIRQNMVEKNWGVYTKILQQYKDGVIHLLQSITPGGKVLSAKKIQKVPHLSKRFLDIWKNEGFKTALEISKDRLSDSIHLVSDGKKVIHFDKSYTQDVYNSYLSSSRNNKNKDYVELSLYDLSKQNLPVKAIAFYLPQYHPISENDIWWGKGFTEWTNVSKAVPNFVGHNQPNLPGELGFYDLRIPEVQQRQVELAQKFGIYGFCFYYYWFNGKRLLDRPLIQFLRNPEIDFPFCLCWANENWTRTWDGLDKEVLIAQNLTPEDDFAFIKDITPYLTNQKYIKINGRPLLIVYRPQLLTDPEITVIRWRKYIKDFGLNDLFLVAIQSNEIIDPRKMGFDAAAEFPPHGIPILAKKNSQLKITNPNFTGIVFDYHQIAEQMSNKKPSEYPLFKTVITGWDNTPRRQDQPLIFLNSSPQVYQSWLSYAIKFTMENAPAESRYVFINAWNEWAESTYLEPDRKYGYAYLDATAQALLSLKEDNVLYNPFQLSQFHKKKESNTAVIFHLYYPELWDEILNYLNNLDQDFDLFVSIPDKVIFNHDLILQKFPKAVIYRCHNRGRDIAPFIKLFSMIEPMGYEYICKIHTKKSLHREDGAEWRNDILDELLGSSFQIRTIKHHLKEVNIGIIGPKNHIISTRLFMGGNQELLTELARKLNLDYAGEYFNFIAGSMFWFKPTAVTPILNLGLTEADFPEELGQVDGTLAHSMERFICLVANKNGYKIIQTGSFTDSSNDNYNFAVPFNG